MDLDTAVLIAREVAAGARLDGSEVHKALAVLAGLATSSRYPRPRGQGRIETTPSARPAGALAMTDPNWQQLNRSLSVIGQWLEYNANLTRSVLALVEKFSSDRDASVVGELSGIQKSLASEEARLRDALARSTPGGTPPPGLLGVAPVMASTTIQQAIDGLKAQVEREKTVNQSAVTLINGIPALIAQATADAQSKGATPDQLAAFDDVAATIQSQTQQMADAVTANTPAANPSANPSAGPAPVTPTGPTAGPVAGPGTATTGQAQQGQQAAFGGGTPPQSQGRVR